VTRAVFQASGTIPVLNDSLKSSAIGDASSGAHVFNTIAGTLSGPAAVLESRLCRILRTLQAEKFTFASRAVVAVGTMGGGLTGSGIEPLETKALLKMFATCSGSEIMESLTTRR